MISGCLLKPVAILTFFLLFIFLLTNHALAQSNEWNSWAGMEITGDINKKLSFLLVPELRLKDRFEVDEYLLEAGLEYKLVKYIEIAGKYRFIINERQTKPTEYLSRVTFDAKGKYSINRFDFQFRARYCNYNELDSDEENDPYFRYRLKTTWNIKKSKWTPGFSVEFFRQLNDHEFNKVRYTVGVEYKINKHTAIAFNYHLQDYLKKDYHRNVLSLEYQIKF